MWKYGKAPNVDENKPQLLAAQNAANNIRIEDIKPCTTQDQSELERLDAEIIHIFDAEIGRQKKKVVDHTLAVIPKFSKDQLIIPRNVIPSSLLTDLQVEEV